VDLRQIVKRELDFRLEDLRAHAVPRRIADQVYIGIDLPELTERASPKKDAVARFFERLPIITDAGKIPPMLFVEIVRELDMLGIGIRRASDSRVSPGQLG
jgi:hypothetical protein